MSDLRILFGASSEHHRIPEKNDVIIHRHQSTSGKANRN